MRSWVKADSDTPLYKALEVCSCDIDGIHNRAERACPECPDEEPRNAQIG